MVLNHHGRVVVLPVYFDRGETRRNAEGFEFDLRAFPDCSFQTREDRGLFEGLDLGSRVNFRCSFQIRASYIFEEGCFVSFISLVGKCLIDTIQIRP